MWPVWLCKLTLEWIKKKSTQTRTIKNKIFKQGIRIALKSQETRRGGNVNTNPYYFAACNTGISLKYAWLQQASSSKIESVHVILHPINSLDTLHPRFFPFAVQQLVAWQVYSSNLMDHNAEGEADCEIDNLLADPAKKAAILQRLTRLDAPHLSYSGSNGGGGGLPPPSGLANFQVPQGAFYNPAHGTTSCHFQSCHPNHWRGPFRLCPKGGLVLLSPPNPIQTHRFLLVAVTITKTVKIGWFRRNPPPQWGRS